MLLKTKINQITEINQILKKEKKQLEIQITEKNSELKKNLNQINISLKESKLISDDKVVLSRQIIEMQETIFKLNNDINSSKEDKVLINNEFIKLQIVSENFKKEIKQLMIDLDKFREKNNDFSILLEKGIIFGKVANIKITKLDIENMQLKNQLNKIINPVLESSLNQFSIYSESNHKKIISELNNFIINLTESNEELIFKNDQLALKIEKSKR